MIQLNRLRLLRELAARGTITAVAEALVYTPSAVSQQLAALERDVGVPLLQRQGRRVILTAAGQALVDGADDVFGAVERATSAAVAAANTLVGPVHVGSFASVGATLIPRAFAALRRDHPGLALHFRQCQDEGLRELQLGHLDVWVDQHYTVLPGPDAEPLDQHRLLTEPVAIAVPAEDDRGDDLAAYADAHWAATTPGSACAALLQRLTGDVGFQPEVRYLTDDLEATLQLVAAGVAVAILPRLAMARVPDGVAVRALPDVERHVLAFSRPDTIERPTIRLVVDALVDAGAAVAEAPPLTVVRAS
jgi:DNA-binding transcriptional LysR family regulator